MTYVEVLAPEEAPRKRRTSLIDCDVKKIMYGAFLAVRDSRVPIERGKITGFHRTVRLRQEHCSAQPQSYERSHQGL